jgi:hypothetical protein
MSGGQPLFNEPVFPPVHMVPVSAPRLIARRMLDLFMPVRAAAWARVIPRAARWRGIWVADPW